MPRYPGGPKRRSRYQPLVDRLAASADAALTLSIAEIEAIIGGPLPPSAWNLSWWFDARAPHVRAWQALGWRARLDPYERCVFFRWQNVDPPRDHDDKARCCILMS